MKNIIFMFRQTIKILGIKVLFVRMADRAGWFAEVKGKEYGDFVKVTNKFNDISNKELVIILKDQAERSIAEIKKNQSN